MYMVKRFVATAAARPRPSQSDYGCCNGYSPQGSYVSI